jgi:molybdopterin molybdotransferase
MREGAVRNSNAVTLPALARAAGAEVVAVRRVGDEPEATREAIAAGLEAADVVVLCGGVSVGEHDHVKGALAALGVEELFWGVSLKPGKPTLFGRRGRQLVFGLPGNPVSAYVCFILFARPALLALQGADPSAVRTEARLAETYEKPTDRAHAIRCRLEQAPDGLVAHAAPQQGSHVLTSMLGADALALIGESTSRIGAGERVTVELLG